MRHRTGVTVRRGRGEQTCVCTESSISQAWRGGCTPDPLSLSTLQSWSRYYLMLSKCEQLLRATLRPVEEQRCTEAVSTVILCIFQDICPLLPRRALTPRLPLLNPAVAAVVHLGCAVDVWKIVSLPSQAGYPVTVWNPPNPIATRSEISSDLICRD